MPAELPSVTGMFYPAERQSGIRHHHFVDEYGAGFNLIYESLLFGRVIRPGTRGKAERRLVGNADCFCNISSRKQHGDGPKQLFAVGRIRSVDIDQDCRLVEATGTGDPLTTGEYARTRTDKALDLVIQILEQFFRRQRPDLR